MALKKNWRKFKFLKNLADPDSRRSEPWWLGIASAFFILFSVFYFWYHSDISLGNALYATLLLFVSDGKYLETESFLLSILRFLGPFLCFYPLFRGIYLLLEDRILQWRISFWEGHTVVFSSFLRDQPFLIELSQTSERLVVLRQSAIPGSKKNQPGQQFVVSFETEKILSQFAVGNTHQVFIQTDDDSLNVELGMRIWNACERSSRQIPKIYVHLESAASRELYEHYLLDQINILQRLHFFSTWHNATRVLWERGAPDCFIPVGKLLDETYHVLVVGLMTGGRELLEQLLLVGHYPKAPIKVTLVDREATQYIKEFAQRCPDWSSIVQIYPVDQAPEAISMQDLQHLREQAGIPFHVAYLHLIDDQQMLQLAAMLLRFSHQHQILHHGSNRPEPAKQLMSVVATFNARRYLIDQFVKQTEAHQVWDMRWLEEYLPEAGHLYFFDPLREGLRLDRVTNSSLDAIAQQMHENYFQEMTKTHGLEPGSRPALHPWSTLKYTYKVANYAQADHLSVKLRFLNPQLKPGDQVAKEAQFQEEIDDQILEQLAEMEHRRWMADRLLNGWTYADKRNDELKLHNLIIPYDVLSEAEKQKDRDTILQLRQYLGIFKQRKD